MNHRWRACAGLLAALALAAGAGGCGGASSDDAGPARTPAAAAASRSAGAPPPGMHSDRIVARPEPRTAAAFALLRTPPEGLPAGTRRILRTPIYGENWALAQRIPVALPGKYWLVPARGQLCVLAEGSLGDPGVGTVCAADAQARTHGIASITVAQPSVAQGTGAARLIVGVAPDGAREALVHTHGAVARAAIVDEIFVVRDTTVAPPDFISMQ